MIGRTISHYKITEKLGEGGMGVVYKAEDIRLKRDIALKFLPTHLLGKADIRARFEREAQAAAALHHPNICPVFEIDEVNGKAFIAMAFIKGESLDKKIAQGPLKLDEALDIAQQIAKGLEAAHKRGIFHRDIKPENVIVDDSGHVTIMDFGLAQLTEASRLTKTDETLGTVAYMSPEQTEGSGTDHRTDIWSLGVVLYEMVTGQPPFKGDYDRAVMYSILNEAPEPITALRTGVPMELEVFVGKCLRKQASKRYQSVAELGLDMTSLRERLRSSVASQVNSKVVRRGGAAFLLRSWERIAWTVAVAALTGALLWRGSVGAPEPERWVRRFSFTPKGLVTNGNRVIVSPDGRKIVYAVTRGDSTILQVRDLADETPWDLPGTEGGSRPFWSPDSRFIGFAADGELRRVGAEGGSPTMLCRLPQGYNGGDWHPDGSSIVFSAVGGEARIPNIFRIPARGGEPEPLLQSSDWLAYPTWIPLASGPAKLALSNVTGVASLMGGLRLLDLASGESRSLGPGARSCYSPSGHILFETTNDPAEIWAVPVIGDDSGFPVAREAGEPSVSADGTLVYVDDFSFGRQRLLWKDRQGNVVGEIGRPQKRLTMPSLSPDGDRVVVSAWEEGQWDLWLHQTDRPVAMRLTHDPDLNQNPSWSPSGEEIAYDEGENRLLVLSLDGDAEPRTAIEGLRAFRPVWSPDGSRLLFASRDSETTIDLRHSERDASGYWGESEVFAGSRYREPCADFSPDGSLVAYCSNESGEIEVYVARFPSGEDKHRISENGGGVPRWRRDGKELFFGGPKGLMSVEVSEGPEFSTPMLLFEQRNLRRRRMERNYDISADGNRFIVIQTFDRERTPVSIHVVENWYEEFRDREQD